MTGAALSFEETEMLLDFGDKGFVVLCAKDDGEGNNFIDEPEEFDPRNFESEFLLGVGIVTDREWKRMMRTKEVNDRLRTEAREREELARLKAKYEGTK